MRACVLILIANVMLVLGGCKGAGPQYAPTATIRDLMDSIVDPNADFLWESVSATYTAKGSDEKMPRTDEEWAEVRRHAIALVESTNLLLVPDRRVAKPGEKADNPEFETDPQEIEAMISRDRATFETRVRALRDAAMKTLAAIESRNVSALGDSGDELDMACEACHEIYWYKKEEVPGRGAVGSIRLP